MDIVTHGLLGALAAGAISRNQQLPKACVVGFLAALFPDMDVLIRSSSDALVGLTYHRHFTHSLVFVPIGALLVCLLVIPLARGKLSKTEIYLFACAGYLSACLLDACTSYGTHLLWPFITEPISLNIIAVVDPVFSFILLLALITTWFSRTKIWSYTGLILACLYLLIGLQQHQRAFSEAEKLAQDRGLNPARILVKPTMANVVLWRSIIVVDQTAYIDAIRVGWLSENKIYQGDSVTIFDPKISDRLPKTSRSYQDLQTYYLLADRLLVQHPDDSNFIGDLRYSMLPDSAVPMWGLEVNPQQPDQAPEFIVKREMSPALREKFLQMLKGH